MNRNEFQESLLQIMERKRHWAWPLFTSGKVRKAALHIHLEQEFEVYVRDFPVLIGRAYVQCPKAAVRRELAENLYEEETGGFSGGRPHPELFLEYPRGLGMNMDRFRSIELLPAARRYRRLIDRMTEESGWAIATCIVTIFIEGTPFDRSVLDPNAPKRPEPPLEAHPLVLHYGLDVKDLALTKAHRAVEGDHRQSAWRVVLEHTPQNERAAVVSAMEEALKAWLSYRDSVAIACGLQPDED